MEEIVGLTSTPYERPAVVDYGSLVDLTATNGAIEAEDGIGKTLNSDGSGGLIP